MVWIICWNFYSKILISTKNVFNLLPKNFKISQTLIEFKFLPISFIQNIFFCPAYIYLYVYFCFLNLFFLFCCVPSLLCTKQINVTTDFGQSVFNSSDFVYNLRILITLISEFHSPSFSKKFTSLNSMALIIFILQMFRFVKIRIICCFHAVGNFSEKT